MMSPADNIVWTRKKHIIDTLLLLKKQQYLSVNITQNVAFDEAIH
mgnify:CR=1 FL=1